MSCLQLSTALSSRIRYNVPTSCSTPSFKGASFFYASRLSCPPLRLAAKASGYKLPTTVCLFGGKGKPGDSSEPPWKGLQNVLDSFKKSPSVEDMLKKQIQKREFADDGGGGGMPPDRGDGSREPGDDDFSSMFEEFIEVLLATLAFIFLYIYIINGDDLIQILKDSVRYLFGARDSIRLQRIMRAVGNFFTAKKQEELPENWLEAVIVNTPTWWDGPEKNKFILKHHPRPPSDD